MQAPAFASTADPGSPAEQHFALVRMGAMRAMMPTAMIGAVAVSLGAALVLHSRIPLLGLVWWLAARFLVAGLRTWHARSGMREDTQDVARAMLLFRLGVLADALIWSALGWALTPLTNLEAAVVTICVLIAVGTISGLTLQMDLASVRLFVLPILVPNAFYALTRPDDLGLFCCVALLGATALLLQEASRSHRRMRELHRLRLQSDATAQAHAAALEQARALSETRSRFLATMSHEMRTPLHGILGVLRMARERAVQPGRPAHDTELVRQLDLIKGSGQHLVSVINDVLDFSRMEADTLPLHERCFNLHGLLAEVAQTWSVSCQDKGLTLLAELEIAPGEHVHGDPMRIRQVLDNLLGNALKFTPRGYVLLRVSRGTQRSLVEFSVQDSGIGIPAHEVPQVFQAFHQAEGTYRRRFGGTGLGLTIARELCVTMGGDLRCRSQEGEGSVFEFTLPLSLEAGPEAESGAPAPATVATLAAPAWADSSSPVPRVLLVEDNPVNALVAEAELRRLGMEVAVRGNGLEAVEWLEHGHADLVLMDCEMPELDGIEATRRIREREHHTGRPRVTIVALTANGAEVYAERCRDAGMDDHLLKPFEPDDLARVMTRHLGSPVT